MGLFSFLKKSGKKIEKKQTVTPSISSAELLRLKIAAFENEVRELDIDVKEMTIGWNAKTDTVSIAGEVESQADREKVILALGNVEGVAQVEDGIAVVEPAPEAVFYEVKSGDSLSKIAKAHYGDAMKYNHIFEANQPMLKDPNLIYPGQVLRIPPLEE